MKKVLITGCSNPVYWYADLVHSVVEVEKITSDGRAMLTAEQRKKASECKLPVLQVLGSSIDPKDFEETTRILVFKGSDNLMNKEFDAVESISHPNAWNIWISKNNLITITKSWCKVLEPEKYIFRIRLFDTIYNKSYKDLAGMEFNVHVSSDKINHDLPVDIKHPITHKRISIEPGDWMEVNPPKEKQKSPEILEKIENTLGISDKPQTDEERNKFLSEEIRQLFDKYDKEGGLIGFIAYGNDIQALGPKTAKKVLELKKDLESAGYKNSINYASSPEQLESIFTNDLPEEKNLSTHHNGISNETWEKLADGLNDLKNAFADSFKVIGNKIEVESAFNKWREKAVKCAKEEIKLVKDIFPPDKISRGVVINQITKDYQSDFHIEYLKHFPAPGRGGKNHYFQMLSDDMKSFFPEDITPAGGSAKERAERTFLNALEFASGTPFRMGIDPAGPGKDEAVVSKWVFKNDQPYFTGLYKHKLDTIFKDPKDKNRGEWKSGSFYYTGNRVTFEGDLYEMILSDPLKSLFPPVFDSISSLQFPKAWKKVPFFPKKEENPTEYLYRGGWRLGAGYKTGDIVKYKGIFYLRIMEYALFNVTPDVRNQSWKPLPDQNFTPDPAKKFIVEVKSNDKWLKEHLLRRQKQLKRAIAQYTSKGRETPQTLKDQLNEIEAQLIPTDGKQ